MSDLSLDPHMVCCARLRMSHLAHWHGPVAEMDVSRLEFAISLSKMQAYSARWRSQTLITALSSHFERKFLFNIFHDF